MELIENEIQELTPRTDTQRSLQARAVQISSEVEQARWMLIEQLDSSMSGTFLGVLLSWLTAIFIGFGLFAPRSAIAIAALLMGALSVSGSIFVIEEMNHPLSGLITISDAPLRNAAGRLGH